MSFEDKTIACVECGSDFTHSAEDQAYHSERGFTNEPKRCPACRQKRRDRGGPRQRESTDVVCAECGATTSVPFKPRQDRPVYCRDCFRSKR